MRKKIKKSVSIILALVMLCGVLAVAPITVGAAVTEYTTSTGGVYTFNSETGELHLVSGEFTGSPWAITKANVKKVTVNSDANPHIKFTGDCIGMFKGFSGCKSMNFYNVNTNDMTAMSNMFEGCKMLEKLDVSSFNVSNVQWMANVFSECESIEYLDLSGFIPSKAESMFAVFNKCYKLKSLDLSNFTTSSAKDMGMMFHQCMELKSVDLSCFDMKNVTNTKNMFNTCILNRITISDKFGIKSDGGFISGIVSNMSLINGINNTLGWRDIEDIAANKISGDNMFAEITNPDYLPGAGETKTYIWIGCYDVDWKNWDGTRLVETETYKSETDSHPTYKGATPTKPNSGDTAYTFVGWVDDLGNEYGVNDVLPEVTRDTTYTARFDEAKTEYTLNYIYQGRKGGNKGGYVGDDGDTDEKTYTVTVELGASDLEESGMPKAKVLVDNAPVVNDPYKDCRWTFTDEYVRFDPETKTVTITAEQPERKYSVVFKDSNNTTTDAFRVKLNEYVKKNDSFITVPETDGSGTKFAYWSVVQNGKEVARCFERRFNLRVTGDSVVTAHYGEAENLVTLSEAEISRQQFTENGTKKDLLYADFITAYMDKQEMKLSQKTGSEYKTGMIVQYSPDVKVAKENAPGATLSENEKIKFASGEELTAANAKTIANGGTVGGKYSYLTAPIDNAKYNDKNRLSKSLVFTNTENARRLVFCAYYYVYNVQKDEIEMTDPVYFYLYDAGNAIVEES